MAVAYDNSDYNDEGNTDAITFAYDAGSGANRALLVAIVGRVVPTVSSLPTYNGVNMVLLGTIVNATSGHIILYGLAGSATGSNNVVVALDSSDDLGLICMSFTGVDQSTPFGTIQSDQANDGGGDISLSAAADDLCADFFQAVSSTSITISATGGQTERINEAGNEGEDDLGAGTEAGAATVEMQWTVSSAKPFAYIGVPVLQVSGGAAAALLAAPYNEMLRRV